ncbi:methyltransferase regulatory domain-containing protein [Magnetococcales bacterium HHB-1]
MRDFRYDHSAMVSLPYPDSRPEHLKTVAKVSGFDSTDIHSARVLELGCIAGGNILPLAALYPDSNFVGVDMISSAIREARQAARELDLNNIEFRFLTLDDLLNEAQMPGPFDYIICHHWLSYVSRSDRARLFQLIQQLLAKQGVACLGYATLPGFSTIRTIRDMSRFHCEMFDEQTEQRKQADLFFSFFLENLKARDENLAKLYDREWRYMAEPDDANFVFHHLTGHNHPRYLYEVVREAETYDLHYLSDARLDSLNLEQIPESARKQFRTMDDRVRMEQYYDFLVHRRFRLSLFCHADQTRHMQPLQALFEVFSLSAAIKPLVDEASPSSDQEPSFQFLHDGQVVQVTHPLLHTLLWMLFEQRGKPIALSELVGIMVQRCGVSAKEIWDFFHAFIPAQVLAGRFLLHAEEGKSILTLSDKPEALSTARYQARLGSRVTNARHQWLPLEDAQRIVLANLDGQCSHKTLQQILTGEVKAGRLKLPGVPKQQPDQLKEEIFQQRIAWRLQEILEFLRSNAFLVA